MDYMETSNPSNISQLWDIRPDIKGFNCLRK